MESSNDNGVDAREAIFSGVGAIRDGHELDTERLEGWLCEHVPDYAGPLIIGQFKGGQSNPTYRLETPERAYVLRRKPPGEILKGAHAVEREYRVTAALHAAHFPVARPYALCTDESVIGTWFYVMEMVEGRIFWDATLPGLEPEQRAAHFDAMNATLARLHSLDVEAIGLGDYGRQGNYFERQIGRWSRQYLDDEAAGRLPAMDRLVEWLPKNIAAGDEVSVVHGDCRADNMIFDPGSPRVLAVLDWELSTLGHPLADFAYHLMMYRLPPEIIGGFAGADLEALGIPSEGAYIATYCRRTGRSGIPDLNFYLAFNMFRLAAILHGIKGRIIRGSASSAHAQSMAATLPQLADIAVQLIEGQEQ